MNSRIKKSLRMRKLLLIIVLPFIFILTSCSRLDFAFNWADTFIASKVDDYFNISFQQSRDLKKSLNNDFGKIKNQILPKLISSAKNISHDIMQNHLTKESVDAAFTSTMDFLQEVPSYFSDTSAVFLKSLNERQFNYFSKAFRKKLNEDSEKLKNKQEYEKELCEKYYKYFEMFLGDLTADQKSLIQKHISMTSTMAGLKIKNKHWLFEKFMKEKKASGNLTNYVFNLSANSNEFNLPEYQSATSAYYNSLQKLIVDILMSASADQTKKLKVNLDDKINQLEKIVHSKS